MARNIGKNNNFSFKKFKNHAIQKKKKSNKFIDNLDTKSIDDESTFVKTDYSDLHDVLQKNKIIKNDS